VTEMTKRDTTVVRYLNEAYANERRLELALAAHLEATTRPEYEQRLRDHLRETRMHASKVARRIARLGGSPETVSIPGPEGLADRLESAQGVVQRATAAVQHSLHAVRRTGEQELMLENARAEFREEAQEIATYRLIDGLATAVGDKETAQLAREILREEERMASYLSELIPQLATDVAHDAVPVSEIDGPAAHRTAAAGARRTAPARAGRTSTTGGATRARRARRTVTARAARTARRTATARAARTARRTATTRAARRTRRTATARAARRTRRPATTGAGRRPRRTATARAARRGARRARR
jgi:ferritin-like metal-binding protein YciE